MLRRDFLSTLCAGAAVGAWPQTAKLSLPHTLDLRVPVRLAASCISNRMDPSMGYRPWFLVEVKDSKPIRLRHDVWDIGDMSGRFLEGLILARNMFEPTSSMLRDEGRIREFLSSHLGPDGLVMNPDKHDVDHMFAQGSALYGLVTDFNDGHSPIVKERIRALIHGLNKRARQEDDYLWFPEVATTIAPCSHMAAYQVLPVVRFFELTREPAALRYAERLSRWAFYHDPTVTSLGEITKTGWEGHLHAWMDTYSGIIRCARAGGNLDRKEVLNRAHLLFEWVRKNYTTPFGWVADSVGSETCETCTISSAIRLALELIKEGYTDYWDDVELFVRNQVIQNQFRDVDRLGIEDAATVRGMIGAFESYAAPNTLIASRDAGIEGCCINGGIRALFLAYANAIQESDEVIQINLLVSNATPGVRVVSHLPFEGRIDLYPRSRKTLKVRLSKWLRAEDVTASGPSGLQQSAELRPSRRNCAKRLSVPRLLNRSKSTRAARTFRDLKASSMHSSLWARIALLILFSTIALAQNSPVSQVDPFIGTQASPQPPHDFGNTHPGATRPFGMLYWSPDPVDGGFYRYEKPVTRGFSLTHLSGPGCGVYGDVPIMPILGVPAVPPPVRSTPYRAGFKHADEVAQPGYYSVKLDSGIEVKIAAGVHSGIAEILYPQGSDAHTLLVDLSRNLTHIHDADIVIQGNRITGSVASGEFCFHENHYRIYFALETEESPQSAGTFDEMQVSEGSRDAKGPRVGGYLVFPPTTSVLHIKVGISYVSSANAAMNLEREIPRWDFEKVRSDAQAAWGAVLDHAVVEGGSEPQRKVFYTAMYHSLLHPTVFNDVNGEYLGFDEKVHKTAAGHNQYANFSTWDIYRSQVQLIALLLPDVASDIAQSLVADAEQGGGLPVWTVANDEAADMPGDSSDGILAGIYAFGGRAFDTRAALKAMLAGADDPNRHVRLCPQRPGLAEYLSKGYVPDDGQNTAGSLTLEYENSDFSIAQFARSLGDAEIAHRYIVRAGMWTMLFDQDTKYIRARGLNGKFLPNFKPEQQDGFMEGNAAQYTWMIPYDLKGLIAAMGGADAANMRLDDYFSQYGTWNGGPYFFIVNEPSFGNPWIYNWTGHPWRAQEVVRNTLTDLFPSTPGGIPGNDDLGATSSWVIFADLGLYPEIPSVGGFTVNSPTFSKATLKLGDHTVEIVAPGAPDQLYIKSLSVDGKAISNWWIDWSALKQARTVEFTLTRQRNLNPGDAPPSF